MNIHEYQAKELLSKYGLPVPRGIVAHNVEEALAAQIALKTHEVVVKAQVHAGGRGKAGGVQMVDDSHQLQQTVEKMIGSRLVTHQTDAIGQPINCVLIQETLALDREFYLGMTIDRSKERIVLMASTEGGVEIEKIAVHSPEKIHTVIVDPLLGILPYQCREIAFAMGLTAEQIKQFTKIASGLYQSFIENDMNIAEINPLVTTNEGDLICLDAKVVIDDNAIYRQKSLYEMRDITQENERESEAKKWGLSYTALEGDIGCMVNGAGLAMATMDLIKLHGRSPANFLDVGGNATAERITEAFKIISADTNVKAILINIFGGIVRCNLIADGIIKAISDVHVNVPLVVRLEGTNAVQAMQKLQESELDIITAVSFADAATKVVEAAGR